MDQYELTDSDLEEANKAGQRIHEKGPIALSARYERAEKKIVVELNNGVEIRFSNRLAQGLSEASDYELSEINIDGDGLGLNFPRIDADLYVPALSMFIFGSEQWMDEIPEKLQEIEQEKACMDKHKKIHENYYNIIHNIIRTQDINRHEHATMLATYNLIDKNLIKSKINLMMIESSTGQELNPESIEHLTKKEYEDINRTNYIGTKHNLKNKTSQHFKQIVH